MKQKKDHEHPKPDPWTDFTVVAMIKVVRQTHNWKSHGLFKLQHFWVKWFFVMPAGLTRALSDVNKGP
jgi:hypothetical protein